ncbi:hypothetical protein BV923_22720 [Pectobacterium odoriferum]|nr:hypothetical protein BV923_22720 [Pectobacterium odoriferum]
MKYCHIINNLEYNKNYQVNINAYSAGFNFRKKNSGVDVELGFAFSLRQATVGRPHTLTK